MKQRQYWIDNIRAIAMISMIIFHAVWDLVYLYGMDWAWYRSDMAFVWQQSICWTFILLSGFCWSFSRNPLKQGLMVSAGGLIVTAVTLLFSYDSRQAGLCPKLLFRYNFHQAKTLCVCHKKQPFLPKKYRL